MPGVDLVKYNPVEAEIVAKEAANAAMIFLYDTPKGNREARSYVHSLRKIKGTIKEIHDDLKRDVLRVGREIDAKGNEYLSRVDAMIEVHQKPLDAIEAEAERIRAEAEAAEVARLAKIEADKLAYREAMLKAEREEAERTAKELADLKAQQERERIAREAADKARQEAEERVRKAEQDKIDAQRRELEEKQRRIDDAKAAEASRLAAEAKAKQDAIDAKARAAEAQRQAVEKAKADAEQKAKDAEAARLKKIADEEAAEAERRQGKTVREKMIRMLTQDIGEAIGTPPASRIDDDVFAIAAAIIDGKIPGLTYTQPK